MGSRVDLGKVTSHLESASAASIRGAVVRTTSHDPAAPTVEGTCEADAPADSTPPGPVAPPREAGASSPPRAPDASTRRRAVLEEHSVTLGIRWAVACRDELRSQGRRSAGGWPGTLREARTRVRALLLPEFRDRQKLTLTPDELEYTARTAYAAARREWSEHAERDESDD